MKYLLITILLASGIWSSVTAKETDSSKIVAKEGVVQARTNKDTERSKDLKRMGNEVRRLKGQVQSIYEAQTGRPAFKGGYQRGVHTTRGQVTLSGGTAIVDLPTTIQNGSQDLSFTSKDTYRGWGWTTDSSNTNTYTISPLSNTRFIIRSSNGSDASTINYMVTGD